MNEHISLSGQPEEENQTHRFLMETVDSAYDLASGGMGVQTHALRGWHAHSADIPDWVFPNIISGSSNYLGNPYVFKWLDPENMPYIPSTHIRYRTDLTPKHKELFLHQAAVSKGLRWKLERATLAGEQGLQVDHPDDAISPTELRWYLQKAQERGILRVHDPEAATHMPQIQTPFELDIFAERFGIEFTGSTYFTVRDQTALSDHFYNSFTDAAVLKLGCMIALTHQLSYDASQSGYPITGTYTPQGEMWEKSWRELFEEDIPDIRTLTHNADTVFRNLADPADPVTAHLFEMRPTEYLT